MYHIIGWILNLMYDNTFYFIYINENNKRYIKFFNAAIFYDYENDVIIEEFSRVRKCIIDSFF